MNTGKNMNKSIIVLKHDDYTNLNDFLLGLEEAIVNGKDSYYTVIISGNVDPLSNPIFYRDGYMTLVRMADVAKHLKTRISIQINTRMPSTVSDKTIKDIFHIYSVGINYYISNHTFERNTQFIPVEDAIKKLETWDSRNPMKTQMIIDIDDQIHPVRRMEVTKAIHNTYVTVGLDDYAQFRSSTSTSDIVRNLLK